MFYEHAGESSASVGPLQVAGDSHMHIADLILTPDCQVFLSWTFNITRTNDSALYCFNPERQEKCAYLTEK